jgi:hypothetical protein
MWRARHIATLAFGQELGHNTGTVTTDDRLVASLVSVDCHRSAIDEAPLGERRAAPWGDRCAVPVQQRRVTATAKIT